MEFIHFFSLLIRNIWKILLGSIIIAAVAAIVATTVIPVQYKTIITFSTAMKVEPGANLDRYDPLSYFESADKFADAILGWFRSPITYDNISGKIDGVALPKLEQIFTYRKQEQQNLNIGFVLPTREMAEKVKDATMSHLHDRVEAINEQTNTNYDLVSESFKIEETKSNPIIFALVAFLAGFICFSLFFYFYEYAQGVASFKEHIEGALRKPLAGILKTKAGGDIAYAGELLIKHKRSYIINLAAKKPGFMTELLHYLSVVRSKKVLLIEATHDNTLRKVLSMGDTIEKTKGFFDNGSMELASLAMPISPDMPFAHILGRGQGDTPQLSKLDALESKYDAVILYTTFPEGMFVLDVDESFVLALVGLGKSKIQFLHILAAGISEVTPFELV